MMNTFTASKRAVYYVRNATQKSFNAHFSIYLWIKLHKFRFVCGFFFAPIEKVSIIYKLTGEGVQVLTYARHSWPLSSEGSLSCHIYCDWMYNGHFRGLVTLTHIAELVAVSVLEFEHPTFHMANTLNNNTAAADIFKWNYTIFEKGIRSLQVKYQVNLYF